MRHIIVLLRVCYVLLYITILRYRELRSSALYRYVSLRYNVALLFHDACARILYRVRQIFNSDWEQMEHRRASFKRKRPYVALIKLRPK